MPFTMVTRYSPTCPQYFLKSEVGESETNREIVSFRFVRACERACVRACAGSGCLVEIGLKSRRGSFPFPLLPLGGFPFSLVG